MAGTCGWSGLTDRLSTRVSCLFFLWYNLQGLKALMNNEENTLDLLLDDDLLFANNPIYKKEEL